MKSINLYGNVVKDLIFNGDNIKKNSSNAADYFSERLGGIVNIVRGVRAQSTTQINIFSSFDPRVKLELELYKNIKIVHTNAPTATAAILESGNDKTSMVFWGRQIMPFKYASGWNHISYLDKIDNIEECVKLQEIHSADLCLGKYSQQQKNKLFNILKFINYLIISDYELRGLTGGQLSPLVERVAKGVVVHSKHGCVYADRNKKYSFTTKQNLENTKIVGAGDIFASIFILSSLEQNSIYEVLKKCNNETPILLKKINKL